MMPKEKNDARLYSCHRKGGTKINYVSQIRLSYLGCNCVDVTGAVTPKSIAYELGLLTKKVKGWENLSEVYFETTRGPFASRVDGPILKKTVYSANANDPSEANRVVMPGGFQEDSVSLDEK